MIKVADLEIAITPGRGSRYITNILNDLKRAVESKIKSDLLYQGEPARYRVLIERIK